MRRKLGLAIKILLGALVLFEAYKSATRFANLDPDVNIMSAVFPAIVAVFTAVILILFVTGREKVPILWYLVFGVNMLSIMAGLVGIGLQRFVLGLGMPLFMFEIYVGLQMALAVALGFYGWSLTQPTDEEKKTAHKKGVEFDSLFKR